MRRAEEFADGGKREKATGLINVTIIRSDTEANWIGFDGFGEGKSVGCNEEKVHTMGAKCAC